MGLSIRAYARRRRVSDTAVRKAIASERIHLEADGSIDPARADREWDASTDPSKPQSSSSAGADRDAGEASTANADYIRARAAREAANARRAQIAARRDAGLVIELAAAARVMDEVATAAKEKLRALPDRLADRMAATSNRDECRRIMAEEIDRVCLELAKLEPPSSGPARPTTR